MQFAPDPHGDELIESCQPIPADEQLRRDIWQAGLRSASDPFRRAFEDAAIGMAIVDLDGRFLRVNQSLCEIVGYDESELMACNFQQITYPDDLEPDLTQARRALSGEIDHYHLEKRYIHKQGHLVWVVLSGSLVRDEEDRPCYFVSQMQDITARKLAEEQSAQRLRSLQLLTHTANQVLRAFESNDDQAVFANVLQIALTAFESRTGMFLRFDDDGELIGPFSSLGQTLHVRCPANGCELWTKVLHEKTVVLENSARDMGCGMRVVRSLVAPILYDDEPIGLVHLASAASDYTRDDCDLLARLLGLIAPAVRARVELSRLTNRESEVMQLIVSGMSQKQIATALHISVQTVAKHRARVLEKLSVRGDVDLVHFTHEKRASSWFGPGEIDQHRTHRLAGLALGVQPDVELTRMPETPEG